MGVSASILPPLLPRSMKGFSLLCLTDLEPEVGWPDDESPTGANCTKGLSPPRHADLSLGVAQADSSLLEKRDMKGLDPPRTDLSMGVPSPWEEDNVGGGDGAEEAEGVALFSTVTAFPGEEEEDNVSGSDGTQQAEGVAKVVACGSPTTPLCSIHDATAACDAKLLSQAWVFIMALPGRFLESFCKTCWMKSCACVLYSVGRRGDSCSTMRRISSQKDSCFIHASLSK